MTIQATDDCKAYSRFMLTQERNNNALGIFNIQFPFHKLLLKRAQILRFIYIVHLVRIMCCVDNDICS
jgi:hypothetical protein